MKQLLKILAIGLICIANNYSNAQTICGHDHYITQWNAQYPHFKNALNAVFDEAAWLSRQETMHREILEVPIVFHIVWKDSIENISDSLIFEELNVINSCFRRLNADTSNTRPIFNDVIGDAMIQFRIHEIKRVHTSATFQPSLQTLSDEMKFNNKGGSDASDPDAYLNIWVCRILPIQIGGSESPLLGYAFPPVGLNNWPEGSSAPSKAVDGVVVDYRTIGGKGRTYQLTPDKIVPMEGKTVVHEIGHYLGLRHIWGDGFLSQLGLPDCNADDGIQDTPLAGMQSMFACDSLINLCNEGQNDRPNMIENYMDYSSETCQNAFTKLQGQHMRGVLLGVRSGLIGGQVEVLDIVIENPILSLFPNPSSDYINIKLHNNNQNHNIANIYTMDGKKVATSSFDGSNSKIDLHHLSTGQYIMKVNNAQGNYAKIFSISRM